MPDNIRKKGVKIFFQRYFLRFQVFNRAIQVFGLRNALPHPQQGVVQTLVLAITAQPVVLDHATHPFLHYRVHHLDVFEQSRIAGIAKILQRLIAIAVPVANEEKIVENIHQNRCILVVLAVQQPRTVQHRRMLIGEGVDFTVQSDSTLQIGRQGLGSAFVQEISQEIARHHSGVLT